MSMSVCKGLICLPSVNLWEGQNVKRSKSQKVKKSENLCGAYFLLTAYYLLFTFLHSLNHSFSYSLLLTLSPFHPLSIAILASAGRGETGLFKQRTFSSGEYRSRTDDLLRARQAL